MKLIKPEFWRNINWISLALTPLSLLYLFVFYLKWYLTKPLKLKQKIICIGNATIGGSGKTPIALAVAEKLKNANRPLAKPAYVSKMQEDLGAQELSVSDIHDAPSTKSPQQIAAEVGYGERSNKQVAFISRGYKGKLSDSINATYVDPSSHTPSDVGEEALLLAKTAPTYINKNRCKSAELAAKNGADFLIMDDGMQNNSIKKDFVILVVDGDYGFGNNLPLPAGPMRELPLSALSKCSCVVTTGKSNFSIKTNKPVFHAELNIKNIEAIHGQSFIAMCGIGNPNKFFSTLKSIDINLLDEVIFPDHHIYNEAEITTLIAMAKKYDVKIITTSKDFIKIPSSLRKEFMVLEIEYKLPEEFYEFLKRITKV